MIFLLEFSVWCMTCGCRHNGNKYIFCNISLSAADIVNSVEEFLLKYLLKDLPETLRNSLQSGREEGMRRLNFYPGNLGGNVGCGGSLSMELLLQIYMTCTMWEKEREWAFFCVLLHMREREGSCRRVRSRLAKGHFGVSSVVKIYGNYRKKIHRHSWEN